MREQEIQALCEQYDVRPAKARGQNFVVDANVIRMMIDHANLDAKDCVVEVGPGFGVLTKELAKRAKKVVAVEIDRHLFQAARDIFASQKNVELVNGDILKITNEKLIESLVSHPEERSDEGSRTHVRDSHPREILRSASAPLRMTESFPYKVVANLPYSITSAILRKFTEEEPSPELGVFMVQKEVAQRVCAKPGAMSVLSVAIQYYGKPEIVATVPRTAFWPEPEVDSAILKIEIGDTSIFAQNKNRGVPIDEKRLFQIVRIGFSSRRKQLVNNLMAGLRKGRDEISDALQKVGLDPHIRAQELSIENWIALARIL